ncbi:MAG: tail fiber domain-containing protein, partial [Bacteroidota bacterium]
SSATVNSLGVTNSISITNGGITIQSVNSGIGIGKTRDAGYHLDMATDNARKLTSAQWATGSDSRLKTDIIDANLDTCYDNVKNMKLRYFKWREDLFTDAQIGRDRHKLGWIAQEIETVFPKAVMKSIEPEYGIEECRSLNNDQIYASMFGAMQKMMQKIETLESTVSELQNEIKNLKN